MSFKKKRKRFTGSTMDTHKDVAKLLPGVSLPALEREGDQQVTARLALGDRISRGKSKRLH